MIHYILHKRDRAELATLVFVLFFWIKYYLSLLSLWKRKKEKEKENNNNNNNNNNEATTCKSTTTFVLQIRVIIDTVVSFCRIHF
jgi:hypothetical protein